MRQPQATSDTLGLGTEVPPAFIVRARLDSAFVARIDLPQPALEPPLGAGTRLAAPTALTALLAVLLVVRAVRKTRIARTPVPPRHAEPSRPRAGMMDSPVVPGRTLSRGMRPIQLPPHVAALLARGAERRRDGSGERWPGRTPLPPQDQTGTDPRGAARPGRRLDLLIDH